jgi:hypothetical protein
MQETGLKIHEVMCSANMPTGEEALMLIKLLASHVAGTSTHMPKVVQQALDFAIVESVRAAIQHARTIAPEALKDIMEAESNGLH